MTIHNRHLANQARTCAAEVYYLAGEVFAARKPADRIVGAHFRLNKKFGSSDRRAIGDTLYALFRWWGWLRLMPGLGREDFFSHDPDSATTHEPWLRALLAAQLLDQSELSSLAMAWKETLGLHEYLEPCGGLPVAERAGRFGAFAHIPLPRLLDLLPAWSLRRIPLPNRRLAEMLDFVQLRPPMWLRAQADDLRLLRLELEEAGLAVTPSDVLPNALRAAPTRVNLYELPAYRDGRFEVQDFASQLVGATCGAQPGERWWDVCAGAGGKTLQLSQAMDNKGNILATDIRGYKLEELKKRARRSQRGNIRMKEWDGEHLPSRHMEFDGVLVDAPCSNTGTWRRNPDARWTKDETSVAEMVELQRTILERVAPAVKPGGVLVYATCSLLRDENEDIVTAFLAAHPEFAADPLQHPITGETTAGHLRIWPDEADSDGMFVARLTRLAK